MVTAGLQLQGGATLILAVIFICLLDAQLYGKPMLLEQSTYGALLSRSSDGDLKPLRRLLDQDDLRGK